jgi:hypothetical protein
MHVETSDHTWICFAAMQDWLTGEVVNVGTTSNMDDVATVVIVDDGEGVCRATAEISTALNVAIGPIGIQLHIRRFKSCPCSTAEVLNFMQTVIQNEQQAGESGIRATYLGVQISV